MAIEFIKVNIQVFRNVLKGLINRHSTSTYLEVSPSGVSLVSCPLVSNFQS